jgi:hypothetical protein
MDPKNLISLIVWSFLTFGGSLFLFISAKEYIKNWNIMTKGIRTKGVVVELVHRPKKVGELTSSGALAPVVRFFNKDGKERLYYATTYTTPPLYQIGQQVELWYLEHDYNAALLKGKDEWILSIAFAIFGAVMFLIGFPFLLKTLWRMF